MLKNLLRIYEYFNVHILVQNYKLFLELIVYIYIRRKFSFFKLLNNFKEKTVFLLMKKTNVIR